MDRPSSYSNLSVILIPLVKTEMSWYAVPPSLLSPYAISARSSYFCRGRDSGQCIFFLNNLPVEVGPVRVRDVPL
jgi:hypothetical protein